MNLLRNITSVTDVKRGGTNINYIYRATTLIWQRSTPVISGGWITSGLNIVLNSSETGWITNGLNIKLK